MYYEVLIIIRMISREKDLLWMKNISVDKKPHVTYNRGPFLRE